MCGTCGGQHVLPVVGGEAEHVGDDGAAALGARPVRRVIPAGEDHCTALHCFALHWWTGSALAPSLEVKCSSCCLLPTELMGGSPTGPINLCYIHADDSRINHKP